MGTHLLKIGYSFVDRNVPDRGGFIGNDTVWDITHVLAFGIGGMSPICNKTPPRRRCLTVTFGEIYYHMRNAQTILASEF